MAFAIESCLETGASCTRIPCTVHLRNPRKMCLFQFPSDLQYPMQMQIAARELLQLGSGRISATESPSPQSPSLLGVPTLASESRAVARYPALLLGLSAQQLYMILMLSAMLACRLAGTGVSRSREGGDHRYAVLKWQVACTDGQRSDSKLRLSLQSRVQQCILIP